MNRFNLLTKCMLFFIVAVLWTSCSDDRPEFVSFWDEDIYTFGDELKDRHYDLFFQLSQSEFEEDILSLRNRSSNITTEEAAFGLSKIIAKIGDSHTGLQLGNRLAILPIEIHWFDDGIFLTIVENSNINAVGKEIVSINGVPMEVVIDSFRTVIAYDNASHYRNLFAQYFRLKDFHKEFGFLDSLNQMNIELSNGEVYTVDDDNFSPVEIVKPLNPLFMEKPDTYYWFEELAEDNLLYIHYSRCRELNSPSFEDFTDQIKNVLDDNSSLEKVVLDLRLNGGGNSSIMKPLIDALEAYVDDGRLDSENIYLIIGRNTFSSALLNSIEIRDRIGGPILGEPSGGKPNHYGEVKTFELPKSKMTVFYSTKYFEISESNDDALYPDIEVEYNSIHYLEGMDPILDMIKSM